MFNHYYRGRRVLVTGHTGFKGSWLSLWLKKLGAQVTGYALPAHAAPSMHEVVQDVAFSRQVLLDVRSRDALADAIRESRPEIIFHLAAQPIVRRSYADPMETLETNILGTAHLLEGIRAAKLDCTLVCITSDKCYENQEWDFAYRETDLLGGHDVYSMSKGAMELVVSSWNRSFFQNDPGLGHVVTVRAGNVIGGGDYAQDRIVPDAMRALSQNDSIQVRNPRAIRPWQHVLECLSGYLWLGSRLADEKKGSNLATSFNFGPEPGTRGTVESLVNEILKHWPGHWQDASEPGSVHEAKLLTLSIEKAAALLNWYPVWGFSETIRQTVLWYRERHGHGSMEMLGFTSGQIDGYASDARDRGIEWACAA